MTFASAHRGGGKSWGCDCDECGGPRLPDDIAEAVRKYKRAKMAPFPNGVYIARQERTLIAREGSLSVWKVILPLGAEPLIEYGNSHRIIYVRQMRKVSEKVAQ